MKKCFVGKSARSDDTRDFRTLRALQPTEGSRVCGQSFARDRCIIMQLRVNCKKMRVNVIRTAFAGWVRKLSAVRLRSILTGFGQALLWPQVCAPSADWHDSPVLERMPLLGENDEPEGKEIANEPLKGRRLEMKKHVSRQRNCAKRLRRPPLRSIAGSIELFATFTISQRDLAKAVRGHAGDRARHHLSTAL